MQCPNDGTLLQMAERLGIEIDYCPQCRGVWLDRGELDKIIDKSTTYQPQTVPPTTNESLPQRGEGYQTRYPKKRKQEGFLSEVFDIFD
jgi:Zn-finger nucleic acid-binding protein